MAVTINGTTGITTPSETVTTLTATSGTVTTPATGDNTTSIATTAFVNNSSLGLGQTWTAFTTTTRASGSPYTNSTGKPIMFCISGGSSGTGGSLVIVISGVTVINQTWGSSVSSGVGVSVIIPAGATYTYTNTGYVISAIAELR